MIVGSLIAYIFLIFPLSTIAWEVIVLVMTILGVSSKEEYRYYVEKHEKLQLICSKYNKWGWSIEIFLFIVGFGFEGLYLNLIKEVNFDAGWQTQLYNSNMHQPINPEYRGGIIVIMALFIIGMIILYLIDASKTPPLITVFAISMLYIGSIYIFIWTYHIVELIPVDILLLIIPVNVLFIMLRLIILKVHEYKTDESRMSKIEGTPFLSSLHRIRSNAFYLPVMGVIFMIPVLGIMALILILFGQAPDAAIKAFTETSDFRLSTKIAPQNLTYDEHYLCTVAAGGDRKLVKPIRKGIRHGHEVTVNRQLQIANAFEEVLMVHMPGAHRRIRHFYDTYGFPIARAIKSNLVADIVYLVMKPLEWMFVIVLYLVEIHPEDRIAMQYTGKTVKDIIGNKCRMDA